MSVNVKNCGSSGVTVEVTELPIAFDVDFIEGSNPTVQISWAEWQGANSLPITGELAPMPSCGKVREAATQAAEYLAGCADDRLAAAAEKLREYAQHYTTTVGREERGKQLG